MSTFDRDEQNIHEALSQITVDAAGLAGQVKNRLNKKTFYATPRRQVRWSLAAAIIVTMSALLVITAAAAALGSFDWLIKKINPFFGEIVELVEVYCEDQEIRMEVIGAQKYANMAIVYLSLQDISGQKRLTKQTDFRDGFSVKMNPQTQKTDGQSTEEAFSFGWGQKLLYFDEVTNTVYYEFNITADSNSPLSDPLELSSFLIYFDEKKYEYEPISLSLSDLGEAETTPIQQKHIIGGTNVPDNLSELTAILTPGHYAPMPHGEDDQWISNIGILDGKLHVQIGNAFNKEFGSNDASLFLMTSDGKLIEYDYTLMFLSDEDHHLLNLEENGYVDAVYKYSEAVFTVNTEELSGYTLCFTGSVHSGVEGRWKVTTNLSDTSQQMRIWTNDVSVEGHLFEHLTLSPLGLQVIGTYEGEECMASKMSLAVETVDGIIPLRGGGGSYTQKQSFNLHWNTETPLDVTTVTAVIINGTRIPVE
ncbi:hypothetical protein [Clostridium formicaceticum]|uniref:DUF4179 domain-containing protein n=1 Tax=Clostridium formicaceticum TaxID=1497 RepID=A0AAC9RQX8_9CLOT|nr:hypothetical protein [Clostridium formicaceticum]AOY75308.1 hypothetical protein BJL90_04955 [Clostridium formicaceticum]ARE89752.1 hypothetical protein CLFO_42330 [Clostridium formicaceticum]